jgi:hypothetical protein
MRVTGVVRKPSYASYPPLPLGQGGDTYFDYNTWVALDLVQAYRMREAGLMRGREAVLNRARAVYALVSAGWCRDPRTYPGGVYWVDAAWNRDRGAAVTAGLAALALHLYELTSPAAEAERAGYLDTARLAYRWLRETLWIADGSEAGLYHDKVLGASPLGDGSIDPSQWIYNQGVPIAAGVMLHRVTGEADYLDQARATADAALAWYGARGYSGQPAIFVASIARRCWPMLTAPGTTRPSTTLLRTCSASTDRPRPARCSIKRRSCRCTHWPAGPRRGTGCWRSRGVRSQESGVRRIVQDSEGPV